MVLAPLLRSTPAAKVRTHGGEVRETPVVARIFSEYVALMADRVIVAVRTPVAVKALKFDGRNQHRGVFFPSIGFLHRHAFGC
jgi:hypothetical protein